MIVLWLLACGLCFVFGVVVGAKIEHFLFGAHNSKSED